VAGVQDVPGGYLQGIVPGACHRAAGAHLVAAGGPAPLCCVLLERGSYSAAAPLRIDSECLDVAFQERLVIVHYRGPALLGADHLDQVAQEAGTPGAVIGGEHVRFQRMRDAGSQIAVLSKHAGRQGEHLLEVRCPRLDLQHLYRPSRLASTVIHPPIMPPAGRGMRPDTVRKATRDGHTATRLAADEGDAPRDVTVI
jgi:hypothetical protein